MYTTYNLDVGRVRQQELIDEANRRRTAKAARKARQDRRRKLAGHSYGIDGRQSTARPGRPIRAR